MLVYDRNGDFVFRPKHRNISKKPNRNIVSVWPNHNFKKLKFKFSCTQLIERTFKLTPKKQG